ncbi:MAG: hypothetical protein AMJ41_03920 [candidate division Zixibacteria bacterium DG_27]|nr:MAG: hypothetical protein AMJ41_03920 [candidate division Zixibacteria bacterium DG_27]
MNPDLCRAVISKSFSEITIERIQSLYEALEHSPEGWDTYAYLVNGEFVFLFPKHQHGADSLKLQAFQSRDSSSFLTAASNSGSYSSATG